MTDQQPPKIDPVRLANAIVSIGMVPGIVRGPKRWPWALEKANALVERMETIKTDSSP